MKNLGTAHIVTKWDNGITFYLIDQEIWDARQKTRGIYDAIESVIPARADVDVYETEEALEKCRPFSSLLKLMQYLEVHGIHIEDTVEKK